MRSQRRMVLALLMSLMLLTGCGVLAPNDPGAGVAAASEAQVLERNVPPERVAELYEDDEVVIVDVREPWEYEERRVPDSILIPLGELPNRTNEIPTDQPVVLLCRSGNRSGQALQYLRQEGFENVHNLVGGINAWERAGLSVER